MVCLKMPSSLRTERFFKELAILYAATFLVVLPITCRNLQYSTFHQLFTDKESMRQQVAEENQQRLEHSESYLQRIITSVHDDFTPQLVLRQTIKVIVTVITQSRARFLPNNIPSPRYLTQTVTRFMELVNSHKETNSQVEFYLNLCNVDPDPEFHKEFLQLSRYSPAVSRFNKLHFSMHHPKEKEKQDYQFCLNKSAALESNYILLVEDDALPHSDALNVISHVVRFQLNNRHREVSYVKFYHPDRLLGYLSTSPERIPELLSVSVILSTVTCFIYWQTKRTSATSRQTHLIIFAMFVVYFIFVALSIGRTNIMSFRRLLSPFLYGFTPAPSCCTQAIMFPRNSAQQLVTFMESATCSNTLAKDDIIEQFGRLDNRKAYLVQPNTFKHIGSYSALRNQEVDPFLL